MASKVFQVQAKDSVIKLNAFDAINAVQNLNLDPRFNEEYYTELGNVNFSAQSRQPETEGSFEVTATGSVAAMLARMNYNYATQAYAFDPVTKGNVFTFTENDMDEMIFDLINLKQPGTAFTDSTLVPNAQLTNLSLRIDSTGTGTETYRFVANLQEAFYKPYCDMVTVPIVSDKLTEIRRNNDQNTTYFRGVNFPLSITCNVVLTETTLQQWATLQGKLLNEAALSTPIDNNNRFNLADFSAMKLIVKYYVKGNESPLTTVTMDNIQITGFSERQQTGGRAERTLGYTGSQITIVGAAG